MSDLKIFTTNIEQKALDQIHTLIKQPAFSECKIRIMPDVHSGSGCVIGFTANLGDKVIPNIVGVDIGCGMLTVSLGNIDIDFAKLDETIRLKIPSGKNVCADNYPKYTKNESKSLIEQLRCKDLLHDIDWLECSLGTLGGGNHFIEIDTDDSNNKYLIIHSGSRNLGKQVADIYQKLAIKQTFSTKEERSKIIADLKAEGRTNEIQSTLLKLKRKTDIPKELCYLEGSDRDDYLHDMRLCQKFATRNREIIAKRICIEMGWNIKEDIFFSGAFHTVHNYIDMDNMVRKGAISAKKNEMVLIPINMKDGCIIAIGKGNEDWNSSAPHGAGRVMSRNKARESISLDEFEKSMSGIFTTSINESTIDESPMAYKPMHEILENIRDTVDIYKLIHPIYNFKASE